MKTNLTSILKASTRQIRGHLNNVATHKGEDCWLFEPEEKEGKVCLVAHIDTVWDEGPGHWQGYDSKGWGVARTRGRKRKKKLPKRLIHDKEKGLIWSPDGLGADDRAGVYAVLKLFKDIPEPYKPYVLLTDYEESGGAGAREAVEIFEGKLSRCNFLIELDRANGKDAVFYNYEPDKFMEYIMEFGFTEAHGSFSDISIICPEVLRCGVNLSIGYYHQHTEREYLDTNLTHATIEKVARMLADNHKAGKVWELEVVEREVLEPWRYSRWDEDDSECTIIECPCCQEEIDPGDLFQEESGEGFGHCRTCGAYLEINGMEIETWDSKEAIN